jgi:hypothetical protein
MNQPRMPRRSPIKTVVAVAVIAALTARVRWNLPQVAGAIAFDQRGK